MKSIRYILRGTIVLTIMALLVIMPLSTAMAYTDRPKDPGIGTNVTGIGTEPWQNPENITGAGSAMVTLSHNHIHSNYPQGTQYGFTIPASAAILGIEVNISRYFSGHPNVIDNEVNLVKGGAIIGENKATINPWPTGFAVATYGGPSDLWGTTWTPEEVNSDNFGVALVAGRDNNGSQTSYAYVDTVQVTIYYAYATTTTIAYGNGTPVAYGDSITCVATVTRIAGDQTPSGTVNWTTDGSGLFDPNPCTLEGADGVSTYSVSYTPTAVLSGKHNITAIYNGDEYFAPSIASGAVTVIQRPITVTADLQTKAYGDPDPDFTYQITEGSLVFSDPFTGTLTRESGEDLGTYPIQKGTLALTDNYDLSYVGADLTITLRPITIAADAKTKAFRQPDPVLTYQITTGSLLLGDSFSGGLTRQPGENAGIYAILQVTLALPDYYEITYVGANLTIIGGRIYIPLIHK